MEAKTLEGLVDAMAAAVSEYLDFSPERAPTYKECILVTVAAQGFVNVFGQYLDLTEEEYDALPLEKRTPLLS